MNKLLKKAFEKAAELPDEKQETLAAIILEEMDSDEKWDELFARPESEALLDKMTEEVREDIRAGRTRPLNVEDM